MQNEHTSSHAGSRRGRTGNDGNRANLNERCLSFVHTLLAGVSLPCLLPHLLLLCVLVLLFAWFLVCLLTANACLVFWGVGMELYCIWSYQLLSASMKDQSWYTVRLFRVGSSHVPKSPAAVRNPIPHSVCRATINGDYIAASTLDCPLWFVRTWHRY